MEGAAPPLALLFEIDLLEELSPGGYDLPALSALFSALLEDDDGSAACEVRQGDLLLHNLAYSISSVSFAAKATRHGFEGAAVRSEGDVRLFQTLIWDLCDSMQECWHSTDLASLPEKLGNREIYVIALSAVAPDLRQAVDARLRGHGFYLGGFEVDPGNPIQQRVTVGGLIHNFDFLDRALLFDPWRSEEPLDPPPLDPHEEAWFGALPFREARYMTEEEREDEELVPRWPRGSVSPRGERSLEIVERRRDRGHLARLAGEASRLSVERDTPPFEVSVDAMARAADAEIQQAKLTGYVLDPDHEKGGSKARWFRAALGIGPDDWRHLAAQLKLGLNDAPETGRLRSTEYGLQYEVTTTVKGLNGSAALVTSAWQVREGRPPRFITAHPAAGEALASNAPPPLVLPASLQGKDRWEALWNLADGHGREAALREIPTPMRIGDTWYPEGEFGAAAVAVRDARRGFARWLRGTGRAQLRRGHGAVLHAPFMARDQALAYAAAFAEVLSLNGIAGHVDSALV